MFIILVTQEDEIWRIMVQDQPPEEIVGETPISKITRAKMDWKCVSSSRGSSLQVQRLEFKP
jgi:hypothetical protein